MSVVIDVAAAATIDSFSAPCECVDCRVDEEVLVVVNEHRDRRERLEAPEIGCLACEMPRGLGAATKAHLAFGEPDSAAWRLAVSY